jgi:hypothetical protein
LVQHGRVAITHLGQYKLGQAEVGIEPGGFDPFASEMPQGPELGRDARAAVLDSRGRMVAGQGEEGRHGTRQAPER